MLLYVDTYLGYSLSLYTEKLTLWNYRQISFSPVQIMGYKQKTWMYHPTARVSPKFTETYTYMTDYP